MSGHTHLCARLYWTSSRTRHAMLKDDAVGVLFLQRPMGRHLVNVCTAWFRVLAVYWQILAAVIAVCVAQLDPKYYHVLSWFAIALMLCKPVKPLCWAFCCNLRLWTFFKYQSKVSSDFHFPCDCFCFECNLKLLFCYEIVTLCCAYNAKQIQYIVCSGLVHVYCCLSTAAGWLLYAMMITGHDIHTLLYRLYLKLLYMLI